MANSLHIITLTSNLLFLSSAFSLLPHVLVNAYRQRAPDTRRGVKWLQQDTSVLVRLDTPDLPLWNPHERIGEKIPSAFIFNFTLQDHQVLLLNHVPILPLKNAFVPSISQAPQTAIDLTQFEHGVLPDFSESPAFDLDYYRRVRPNEHPNSHYNIYNPVLEFDVLGAGIAGYNTLLADDKQRIIRVSLAELEPYQKFPYDKPISQRSYKIVDVVLQDRYPYNQFATPNQLKGCTIWSWTCSDIDEYPWYHYVYREAFDKFGKIGSLRHSLLKRYHVLSQKLGVRQAAFLVVVVILAIFSVPVYGIIVMFRQMKAYFEPCGEQNGRYEALLQAEEEEEELKDEDVESGLVVEKLAAPTHKAAEGEGSKMLPPLPDGACRRS